MFSRYSSDWANQAVSADDVVAKIESHTRAFVHGACATPAPLLEALARRTDLEGVRVYHLHTAGAAPFATPDQVGRLTSISLFTGAALRGPIAEGRADFIPAFLSDIPGLFRSRRIPLDVAIVQLSPPDRHGFCSLGTSVDAARAAVDSATIVLAEINRQMPRTHGGSLIPLERVTAFALTDRPLLEHPATEISKVEDQIGEIIAELVPDGATLQMGIGGIPNAVLNRLGNKVDLGIHSEMFSDGVVPLVEGGVITNRLKAVAPGVIVTSFVSGTRKLFDFVDDNPLAVFLSCDRTNDPAVIRRNDRMIAINSALQIDLTGQVCADSIGHRIYSGIGGQLDFLRGAALSREGKPIIALPSTAARGQISRIVSALTEGAGVVTTRGHVHWVVTEYGAVNLHGLPLRERGEALASIAHPDFRSELLRDLRNIRNFSM